ncbi:hypothetical protein KJ652_00365 [Patescibacteria group bacterium]|nr:hypothetical protein [Patescibacteria group bacterium]MBU1123026.1 hypothetical protein [Patescibacteria group bacterium]MBU1911062.1 hypothetical protein [Patescibacteria group bacterium]
MISDTAPEAPGENRLEHFEFPVFRNQREFGEYMSDIDYDVDRLHTTADSVGDREDLMAALQKKYPELNGNASKLVEHLRLNHQELERKESWFTKLKKMPGRAMKATWETVKAHPYITAAVVLGITAAALYYTGAGATAISWIKAKVMGSLLGEGVAGAGEVVAEAGEVVAEAGEVAGNVADAVGEAAGAAGETIPEIMEQIPNAGNLPGAGAGAGGTLPTVPTL